MDYEKEIIKLQQDLTELKEKLCLNRLLRWDDFLTNSEKGDLLNKRKYMCLICGKAKEPEQFITYNEQTAKGICKACYNTNFPGEY